VRCSKICYQRGPQSGTDAFDATRHGDTDAAFPRGKPSSDQRRAAKHLGDGALPRCRHHERTGATRISSGRHERRGLDDASRGLGARSTPKSSGSDSEMAPQPIVIARNGLGNGRAASSWGKVISRKNTTNRPPMWVLPHGSDVILATE
jgi:hypothetical protein